MKKTSKTIKTPVADICLYGTRATGAGWLAAFDGQLLGDGEPRLNRSFTEAVWLAVEALQRAGAKGSVVIFDSGGERMSVVELGHVPSYGSLTWQPAAVIELNADSLMEAAVTARFQRVAEAQ